MSARVRQFHRWVSVVFTITVVANIAVMSARGVQPPPWVTYAPLLPLAVLQFSGLYLLVLPWVAKRRAARSTV